MATPAQDFESVFDLYDTFCCERFSIGVDAALNEFRSTGYSNGNPFGATDFICEIYHAADEDDLCDDDVLPGAFLTSTRGVGFYDGVDGVTDFAGQCLPAGSYILRWGAEMNFGTFGQIFWFAQRGAHDNGGGAPEDGFQSNPGNAFGFGICFAAWDRVGLCCDGINFVLCGDEGSCDAPCPDPTGCGDWDGDGDSDGEDFFGYLDAFSRGDPCADVNENGTIDADDFFAFLDRFVSPC